MSTSSSLLAISSASSSRDLVATVFGNTDGIFTNIFSEFMSHKHCQDVLAQQIPTTLKFNHYRIKSVLPSKLNFWRTIPYYSTTSAKIEQQKLLHLLNFLPTSDASFPGLCSELYFSDVIIIPDSFSSPDDFEWWKASSFLQSVQSYRQDLHHSSPILRVVLVTSHQCTDLEEKIKRLGKENPAIKISVISATAFDNTHFGLVEELKRIQDEIENEVISKYSLTAANVDFFKAFCFGFTQKPSQMNNDHRFAIVRYTSSALLEKTIKRGKTLISYLPTHLGTVHLIEDFTPLSFNEKENDDANDGNDKESKTNNNSNYGQFFVLLLSDITSLPHPLDGSACPVFVETQMDPDIATALCSILSSSLIWKWSVRLFLHRNFYL
jgi:hypothetical protein